MRPNLDATNWTLRGELAPYAGKVIEEALTRRGDMLVELPY